MNKKMKIKPIKPGMVIHCQTIEEAENLVNEIEEDPRWIKYWNDYKDGTCYRIIAGLGIDVYGLIGGVFFGEEITEFSDLIIPEEELSAVELLKTITEICSSQRQCNRSCPFFYVENDGCIASTREDLQGSEGEVVEICHQWKADHEKKEPEVEWVWEVTTSSGDKFVYFSEEQAVQESEEIVKECPDKECTYRCVCRVKE